MKNNYSTLSNTYNSKTVNQTYTDTVSSCTDRPSCSNHGDCVQGACLCDPFRLGDNCEKPQCTDRPSCSNHGDCVNGICRCDPLWLGKNCENPQCTDSASCSNNGNCMQGQCYCNDRFYGDNCELIDYTVPPCDENEGWVLNPSYNECVYKCTKDGQIASNFENNNDNAYKYVAPPLGSQGAGKCYRIFDQLDHDSRKESCYTDYNPFDGGVCVYWQGSPAIHKWNAQDWISNSVDQCGSWPTCNLYLKNDSNVVAAEGNPIDYFNPVYYEASDTAIQIKWGDPNEKGIDDEPSDERFPSGLDISIQYPSIPTS